MKEIFVFIITMIIFPNMTFGRECKLPERWDSLCNIIEKRLYQTLPKMKLKEQEVIKLEKFLNKNNSDFKNLVILKNILPKTTLELLMSICFRNVSYNNAEAIAKYLEELVKFYKFNNISAFDNNTSHIIGREFHEINYSGENLIWYVQKKKYGAYGITNFKTLKNLKLFFSVESKLPYFNKIYRPKKPI